MKKLPLYMQIRNEYAAKILSGSWLPGDRIPGEKQIVDEYGVSRITATKALNELTHDGLILRHQGKGSFVSSASSIPPETKAYKEIPSGKMQESGVKSSSRTYNIAAVLPGNNDYHLSLLLYAIEKRFSYPDFFLTVFKNDTPELEVQVIRHILDGEYDGVIIYPFDSDHYSNEFLMLNMSDIPLVYVDRYPGRLRANYVTSNNVTGTDKAVDELYRAGHRNIAFMTLFGFSETNTQTRYNTYLNNIVISKSLIPIAYEHLHDNTEERDGEIAEKIRRGDITAIISCNIMTTKYLLRLFGNHGISMPDDVSLITFDKIDSFLEDYPPVSFIDQHSLKMGQLASEFLAENVLGGNGKMEGRAMILEPDYVDQGSVRKIGEAKNE